MDFLSDDELDNNMASTSKKSTTPKKKRAIRNELTQNEKKRSHKQLFRSEWLQMSEFKNWMRSVPDDDTKFKCIACNSNLRCGKSEIEKHAAGGKHKSNLKGIQGTPTLNLLVRNIDTKSEKLKN